MSDTLSFNKVINDFYIQIQLTQNHQISFILVQNKREQCYELKFRSNNMPSQLSLFFRNVNQLYEYLLQMQDNRMYFDISSSGNIRIKKYIKDNNNVSFKTIQIPTLPVKIKDPTEDIPNLDEEFRINSTQSPYPDINQLKQRCQDICSNASVMIQNGANVEAISHKFGISRTSVMKMFEQMKRYGRIFPPYRYRDSFKGTFFNNGRYEQDETQPYFDMWQRQMPIGPVSSNMKMHGQGVRGIKKLLYVLVKQGKMQSLDEMRNYLLSRNIDRSLSSIYRYVSSIKAENPQFQGRNYTMYRKDIEPGTENDKKIEETTTSK